MGVFPQALTVLPKTSTPDKYMQPRTRLYPLTEPSLTSENTTMAGNLSVTAIQALQLNPLTPMAFLPPDAGYQATIAAYGMVGSAGALMWDILSNLDSDYKLLFRHRIGFPTLVYFFSRLGVLAYVLVNVIFQTAALPDCRIARKAICGLYHIAFSCTSLLFFLRVRAVFLPSKRTIAFFFFLWLCVLGASLTVAATGDGVRIGPTGYCTATNIKQYAIAAPIAFAVNDTFVFGAVSWRLVGNYMGPRDREGWGLRSMVRGEYLPAFSRALLQGGQVYYLVSVTSNIAHGFLAWVVPAVPTAYRLMFTIINVTLTNAMACRVFRHTRFGDFSEDGGSSNWVASQLGRLDLEPGRGDVSNDEVQIPQLPCSTPKRLYPPDHYNPLIPDQMELPLPYHTPADKDHLFVYGFETSSEWLLEFCEKHWDPAIYRNEYYNNGTKTIIGKNMLREFSGVANLQFDWVFPRELGEQLGWFPPATHPQAPDVLSLVSVCNSMRNSYLKRPTTNQMNNLKNLMGAEPKWHVNYEPHTRRR
ncbi:hypothetical protein DXG01_002053 [Tephrocybe rancida]|nr:hypothetical protein DXG01_002053 [Tephrocybe rancida]